MRFTFCSGMAADIWRRNPMDEISVVDRLPSHMRQVTIGRIILLLLTSITVIPQLFWVWNGIPDVRSMLQVAVWDGLWYAVWRGHAWATSVITVFSLLGLLLSLVLLLLSRETIFLRSAISSGIFWLCFAKSKSVSEYLRYRQSARQ
jgi:hypothetical protein